jgi:hypothetical protein
MQRFHSYLNEDGEIVGDKSLNISEKQREKRVFNFKQQRFIEVSLSRQKGVYVTKWLRTKHALMFRLNVKLV